MTKRSRSANDERNVWPQFFRPRVVTRTPRLVLFLALRLAFYAWLLKKRQVFAVPFFLQFFDRNKTHRSGVNAVALTGGGGAIVKDMAEMGITFARKNLRPLHAVGRIPFFRYFVLCNRLGETGPARGAIEFIQGAEERLTGDNIDVDSRLVIVPIGILKRSLGAAFARHVILVFCQLPSQFGIIGDCFRRIHFLGLFFLPLSIAEQDRANNHNKGRNQSNPQSFMRTALMREVSAVHFSHLEL